MKYLEEVTRYNLLHFAVIAHKKAVVVRKVYINRMAEKRKINMTASDHYQRYTKRLVTIQNDVAEKDACLPFQLWWGQSTSWQHGNPSY